MNPRLLEEIAEAVLYEGYILYPYRPTSKKNQRERFTFGRVYPEVYSQCQNGAEPCFMQTECLLRVISDAPRLSVEARFLHPAAREIGQLDTPQTSFPAKPEPTSTPVPEMRVGTEVFQAWHEAVERRVAVPALTIGAEEPPAAELEFRFPAWRDVQPICDGPLIVGVISRSQAGIEGHVQVTVQSAGSLRKITVRLLNRTAVPEREIEEREAISLRTFASAHVVLTVDGGEFLSLMDPPAEAKELANRCRNIGAWPVLVGDEAAGARDAMLASPIILYDYPKIAPESAGPLFDGTEIDEILTLRILTLSDAEKLEMAQLDEHGRRLLERTEALGPASLRRMHGTARERQSQAAIDFDDFFGASTTVQGVTVEGVYLRAGDRVRIRPKARADILDEALQGQIAVIQAVEQDLEKRIHLALVLDNDPGKDLGLMRQTGHRFFYGVDEVEPVREEVA